jgi:hypothetical protein
VKKSVEKLSTPVVFLKLVNTEHSGFQKLFCGGTSSFLGRIRRVFRQAVFESLGHQISEILKR